MRWRPPVPEARPGTALAVALAASVLVLAAAPGAAAQGSGDLCLDADPPPVTAPAGPLRFGITPQLAGSAGAAQQDAVPLDEAQVDARLAELRVRGRDLVVRLNRMFWSDEDAGIAKYAALVDRYAAAGLKVELQVRYHPPEGRDGDIDGWVAYVRRATRVFAAKPAVVGLSITNEANLPISSNTSDGTYKDVVGAIVRGVVAAREEADALGRRDLTLGFTYASRYLPNADAKFFSDLGTRGTPAFRAALDHVGLQLYPGLFWPPVTTDAPGDVLTATTLLRTCLMPKAGLGAATKIWITENGYPTRARLGETQQAADLRGTVAVLSRYAGTLGVTDYRYFNLRDNRSTGTDLFDAVGLLFDDGVKKTAFGTLRGLVERYGAPAAPVLPVARPRLTVRVTPSRVRRGRTTTLRVRVLRDGAPAGRARVRVGRRSALTTTAGVAQLRVRLTGRPGRRSVRVSAPGATAGAATLTVTRSPRPTASRPR